MKILSVNLGKTKTIKVGAKPLETGIYKIPTSATVFVDSNGIQNDFIADDERHGGEDQAVYLYSASDYAGWENELQQDIPFATFGENLTLNQFTSQPLRIGDRFEINDVVLEITFGRVPCATLSARMNDSSFLKKFVNAARCGVYTRVIQKGFVKEGDSVRFIRPSQDYPTVKELYALFHAKVRDPDLLQKGLMAPIASRAQSAFRHWLEQKQ